MTARTNEGKQALYEYPGTFRAGVFRVEINPELLSRFLDKLSPVLSFSIAFNSSEEYISKSDAVSDLIRKARAQQNEIEAIRAKLIKAENSGFIDQNREEILKNSRTSYAVTGNYRLTSDAKSGILHHPAKVLYTFSCSHITGHTMTRRNRENITESLKEKLTTESTEKENQDSVLSVVKNEFRCGFGILARSRRPVSPLGHRKEV